MGWICGVGWCVVEVEFGWLCGVYVFEFDDLCVLVDVECFLWVDFVLCVVYEDVGCVVDVD